MLPGGRLGLGRSAAAGSPLLPALLCEHLLQYVQFVLPASELLSSDELLPAGNVLPAGILLRARCPATAIPARTDDCAPEVDGDAQGPASRGHEVVELLPRIDFHGAAPKRGAERGSKRAGAARESGRHERWGGGRTTAPTLFLDSQRSVIGMLRSARYIEVLNGLCTACGSNSSFTDGRMSTTIVNTPRIVPKGVYMHNRAAMTRQNT